MSPRPNVSDERKAQIINAAQNVFTQKGFNQARMDDIANETGLSKGTLYLYFNSKDDLIIAILDRMFQRELKQMEILDSANLSATETIWKMTETLANEISGFVQLVPIIYQFLALAFRNKHVQQALKKYINSYIDILIPIIEQGIKSGEFHKVNAHEVAVAISAIIEGTLLLWVYDRSLVEPEKHIRSGIKLLLEGLQTHP